MGWNDGRQACQRLSPPVHGDVREELVLDAVPLARPGRIVTDRDRGTRTIGEFLQLPLPQARLRPVSDQKR